MVDKSRRGEVSEHFRLPKPVAELIRQNPDLFEAQWFNDLLPFIVKLVEWTAIFVIGYWNIGYGWVVFLATLHYVHATQTKKSVSETVVSAMSANTSEKDVIVSHLSVLPSWVNFPDFDRVEWINDVIRKLWPSIDAYSTFFIQTFIEPKIKEILDRMQLKDVSGFQVQRIILGNIPLRLGGIKVYNDKRVSVRDEILMDAEIIYAGDARVQFTLQGVKAEINKIKFKGMARISLKPILNTFPFIGGFEFYFLNRPVLEYSLGGLGTFAELPGVSTLVRNIVEDQIKNRFVWPNRFHVYLPIESVSTIADKSYQLRAPMAVLTVNLIEASDLLRKDKTITGSGKSDPYAVIAVGERKFNFRDSYIEKTVDPVWNYSVNFVMEDAYGQDINIDVFDFDAGSTDDFLGRTAVPVTQVVEQAGKYEKWIELSGVKHGKIHLSCLWQSAYPSFQDVDASVRSTYIVTVYVDSCRGLRPGSKTPPSPKCVLRMGKTEAVTNPQSKTSDPIFESSHLFVSKEPHVENVVIDVVDSKGGDSLGKVLLPVTYLIEQPRKEFFDMEWDLSSEGKVMLSARLFSVQE